MEQNASKRPVELDLELAELQAKIDKSSDENQSSLGLNLGLEKRVNHTFHEVIDGARKQASFTFFKAISKALSWFIKKVGRFCKALFFLNPIGESLQENRISSKLMKRANDYEEVAKITLLRANEPQFFDFFKAYRPLLKFGEGYSSRQIKRLWEQVSKDESQGFTSAHLIIKAQMILKEINQKKNQEAKVEFPWLEAGLKACGSLMRNERPKDLKQQIRWAEELFREFSIRLEIAYMLYLLDQESATAVPFSEMGSFVDFKCLSRFQLAEQDEFVAQYDILDPGSPLTFWSSKDQKLKFTIKDLHSMTIEELIQLFIKWHYLKSGP